MTKEHFDEIWYHLKATYAVTITGLIIGYILRLQSDSYHIAVIGISVMVEILSISFLVIYIIPKSKTVNKEEKCQKKKLI